MSSKKDLTGVEPTTKQIGAIIQDEKGRFVPGNNANPDGKGGFGDNPDNRSNGSWKKEDTGRYKLEKMMTLNDVELQAVLDNPNSPRFEKMLAEGLLRGQWTTAKEMMDQVYGRNTTMDMNVKGEEGIPLIKGFVIPSMPGVLDDDETAA